MNSQFQWLLQHRKKKMSCQSRTQNQDVVKRERKVKVAQSCQTLCNTMDRTGIPVHGILQARILEWVAFPFSKGSSQPRDRTQVSCIAGGFFTS